MPSASLLKFLRRWKEYVRLVTPNDMKSDTYASLRFASDVLLSFVFDLFKTACFLAAFARSVSRWFPPVYRMILSVTSAA